MRYARTPLMRALQRAYHQLLISRRSGIPPDEVVEIQAASITRRSFVRTTASAAALTALSGSAFLASCGKKDMPTVAIVGAGIAGLYAAYILRNAGITAQIYEASNRTGGRILTARNLMGVGTHTELGGEFIDSTHTDMLRLADDFNLTRIDTQTPEEQKLTPAVFFIGNRVYSDREILDLLAPFVPRIQSDIDKFSEEINYQSFSEHDQQLDRTSLAAYLEMIGVSGSLYKLLDVAYTTEYGLDIADQSCINFLMLINPDMHDRFKYSGYSDERYKIMGGNQSITESLSDLLEGQVHTDKTLVSITELKEGDKVQLDFTSHGGGSETVVADFAIITIPFTVLRDVDIRYPMSEAKRMAIAELGYGQNAKFFIGMQKKVWREHGATGFMFSDSVVQNAWDHTQLQNGQGAGFTVFTGGAASKVMGDLDDKAFANLCLPVLDQVFPGMAAAATETRSRFFWPTYAHTRASYVCFKPGQYTSFEGAQSKREGRLLFAGEHCSFEFQGFMNGAASTGREAAEQIIMSVA